MKISVIIPVYNVEGYLKECVLSVLKQSYQNFEIILIDDGSTDCSGKICDNFSKKDGRIFVVHKQNGGLSSARNVGIQHATGDYLMFLDSDDYWYENDCLKMFVSRLKGRPADILTFRYKKYFEKSQTYFSCLPDLDEGMIDNLKGKNEIFKCLLDKGLYLSSACNKIVRKQFIIKNKLYFREGITSEDIDWCARCMICAKDIIYSNLDTYVYRQREKSISHSLTYKNIEDLKNNIIKCVELGKTIEKIDDFYKIYYTFVAYQYGVFLLSHNLVEDIRIREIRKEMRQYRWLLDFNNNKKIKVLYLINKLFGYNSLLLCMKVYTKIRKD